MVSEMDHKAAMEGVRKLVNCVGTANVLSQSGRLHGSAGIPDVYCQVWTERCPALQSMWEQAHSAVRVLPPIMCDFWVEVKVGDDKLSPGQKEFKRRADACHRIVIVGTAVDVAKYLGMRMA